MNAFAPLPESPAGRGQRPMRTRASLLAAAERLFAVRSIEATSIDDITLEAGVAKGSFYNHFPGKQSIAREVVAQARADVAERVSIRLAGDWSPPEMLARGGMTLLRYMLEHRNAAQVLRRFSPSLTGAAPLKATVDETLRRGMEERCFRQVPSDAARLLVAGVEIASLERAVSAPFDTATLEDLKGLVEMMMAGLGVSPSLASAIVEAAAQDVLAGLAI